MNPLTNRKVSIYSKKGVSIIKHYLNQSGGAANNETRYLGPRSSARTLARESDYFNMVDKDILSQKLRMILNLINTILDFQKGRGSQKILSLRDELASLDYKQQD